MANTSSIDPSWWIFKSKMTELKKAIERGSMADIELQYEFAVGKMDTFEQRMKEQ